MSGARFVLTTEARADIIEIWTYIAEDSVDAADQAIARLYEAFMRLGKTPKLGNRREDLADSRHRFWTVYSYVVVYRWQTTPIQIVAIVHGARQLEVFLQQRVT